MKLTKTQSKQLRYICGVCGCWDKATRIYTNIPEGKRRTIGIFRYTEAPGELLSFECLDGDAYRTFDLTDATMDTLLAFIKTPRDIFPGGADTRPGDSEEWSEVQARSMADVDAVREISMDTAAREALRLCGLESAKQTAAAILKEHSTHPRFLETYWKCLEKVGTPRTLDEVVAIFPEQRDWVVAHKPPAILEGM